MAPGKVVYCEGSRSWTPDSYLADTELHARAEAQLAKDDLRSAILTSFALPRTDTYVYHAMVAVTLAQVQQAVTMGGAHGLHNWYYGEREHEHEHEPKDVTGSTSNSTSTNTNVKPSALESGSKAEVQSQSQSQSIPQATQQPQPQAQKQAPPPVLPPPPRPDIDAYLAIFQPTNNAATALKNFASNAKKASLRRETGAYLKAKRYLHPALGTLARNGVKGVGGRRPPANPYLTFLGWACGNLEWCGPCESSERGRGGGHQVLPVLMHHFGCVCPSYEALEILRVVAAGREIVDVGSGNGYWTRMLREHYVFHAGDGNKGKGKKGEGELPKVTPVDSAQSSWRTNWVDDTIITDGAAYLREGRNGARDAVLLLVYPIVGGGVAGGKEGGFTRGMLDAYLGDTVAVVGTQNGNGYTGFRGMTMDQFMERERGEWTKVVQVPLLSFPGKDEALFVFCRGDGVVGWVVRFVSVGVAGLT
ncbi:hypothetical protein F4808DRAFT_467458 [Astrocystis sublimbata]|nr:hypothetical protein F4808DRAFT_467458 [Astrocystis sublimbata]